MQEFKIIFAGSMGAGKSTAIQSIADGNVVSTDVSNTDRKSHSKLLTTVGIDYGQILLPPDTKIGLYGTPGQDRFEHVWKIVTQGALGVIVLIDSSSQHATKELPHYLDYFHQRGMDKIIVGITHCDLDGYLSMDNCFDIMGDKGFTFPIFEIDARQKDDILLLIETLIASIEADLE